MNRATPVQLRDALMVADIYAKAGIRFVAVPVVDEADFASMTNQAIDRLDKIEKLAKEAEKGQ